MQSTLADGASRYVNADRIRVTTSLEEALLHGPRGGGLHARLVAALAGAGCGAPALRTLHASAARRGPGGRGAAGGHHPRTRAHAAGPLLRAGSTTWRCSRELPGCSDWKRTGCGRRSRNQKRQSLPNAWRSWRRPVCLCRTRASSRAQINTGAFPPRPPGTGGRQDAAPASAAYSCGKNASKLPTSSTLCLIQARPRASSNTSARITGLIIRPANPSAPIVRLLR